MIKHFKIFESYKKYEIGDYVITYNYIYKDDVPRYGEIEDILTPGGITIYIVKLPSGETTTLNDNWIERKLTKSEIKDYKTEEYSKKYNL